MEFRSSFGILCRGDLSSPPAVGSLFAGYPAECNTNFSPGLTAPLILVNTPSAVVAHWQLLRLRPPIFGHRFPVSGAPLLFQFFLFWLVKAPTPQERDKVTSNRELMNSFIGWESEIETVSGIPFDFGI